MCTVILRLLLPCLSMYLLTFPIKTKATSEFWTKAQETLILSQTRSDRDPQALAAPTRDPILDDPMFLPLCGNGRVDTKADYTAYYADLNNLPLTLTKQQILYGKKDVVDPNMLHNITILADEECDDGNRFDLDGCSADCMHVDAWTSSCEIAVEIMADFNNKSYKTLVYEDIIFDNARNVMVVSALDGIYSLSLTAGDIAVKARLIASKSFPVTNIFKQSNSFILYSSKDQTFWQLSDGDSGINLIRNLSYQGLLSEWNDRGHFTADGSIIVHNSTDILFFETPSAVPVSCSVTDGSTMQKCVFVQFQQGFNFFQCTSVDTTANVMIGSQGCMIFPLPSTPSDSSSSLLYDVMDLTTRQTAMFGISPYSMDVIITPDQPLDTQFMYAQYYTRWGALIESPISSARKLGSAGLDVSPNQMHFLGDSSIVSMLTLQDDGNCGPSPCGLDTKLGYDILDPNPLKSTAAFTWGDILQNSIIKEASKVPALLSISAIKDIPSRYSSLINEFTSTFMQITEPLAVLAFQRHPITHNLWAVRHNRLVEISKSGVQLQRRDGKCIPSGIALCPSCQWAPSGSQCRPCSQVDANSWAWNAKCKNQACTGRRLLAGVGMTSIRFILTGDHAVITSYWPDAVQSDLLYNVVVTTADPITEMRQIRERLALIMRTVQVVTQPYETILVGEANSVTLTMTTSYTSSIAPTAHITSTPQSRNTTPALVTVTTPIPQSTSRPVPYDAPHPVTQQDNTSIIVLALAIPILLIATIIIAYSMNNPGPMRASPNARYIPIKIPPQRFYVIQRV